MTQIQNDTRPKKPVEPERLNGGTTFQPLVDVAETRDAFLFKADVPGAARDGIEITCADGVLTIEAQVPMRQPADQSYVRQEYEVGDFRRAFAISEAIDADKITAELRNGELTITVPKAGSAATRKISISAG